MPHLHAQGDVVRFWALAVRKVDLLQFEDQFRHHAVAMLSVDGSNETEIARLLAAPRRRFVKTNSPKVTRSMNDDAFWATGGRQK